jgi:uncharacterized protein YkwD
MKKAIAVLVIVLSWLLAPSTPAQQSTKPLPIFPQARVSRNESVDTEKAYHLYKLLRKENGRLRWDSCLASKAVLRARRMVKRGYFEHNDPQTGKNPAWELVRQCVPSRGRRVPAGENLSKGVDTPENIHRALMNSPTHRKNILDPRFNRVGVGCYSSICVQLFAGF